MLRHYAIVRDGRAGIVHITQQKNRTLCGRYLEDVRRRAVVERVFEPQHDNRQQCKSCLKFAKGD